MNHMHFGRHHGRVHALTLSALLTVSILTASTGWGPLTLAATWNHNAHGVIGSCSLVGATTYIKGWAHDPDAPSGAAPSVTINVGTQSSTVLTIVEPWHNKLINQYLDANWPNAPKGDTYGFSASFTGLYKGTAYNISGTANNVGEGSSNNLKVDTASSQPDGIHDATLFNDNNTLPDACLNTKPAPPPPPNNPPPTTPPPSGGGNDGGGSDGGSDNPAGTSINSPADGSVAAGTLNAVVTVPADGASMVRVDYGTDPNNLDSSTEDVDASSGSVDVELDGLSPRTDYYYQIVRTDGSGNSGTSTQAGFKTSGYTISLHFIDDKNKPVSGIDGALDDADKTSTSSNKNGNMVFADLDAGQYTVTYHYGKLNYTKEFDTENASDGSDNPGKTIQLTDTVNVSKLTGGSTAGYTGPKHHSAWKVVFILLLLIGAAVAGVLWFLRRRNAALYGTVPSYTSMTPDIVDKPTPAVAPLPLPKKHKPEPSTEHLEHVGESLRDMVIQSMHEEAQKRKTNHPGQ